MAVDLVNLVSRILTPQLVGSLARAVGVNEAVAQKLVAAAIPTVLASLVTMASAPGGAQKLADAVANSDPDLLTKLSGAISSGNVGALDQGANLLGGLLGGSGLSNLAGALSQYAGAPDGAGAIGNRRGRTGCRRRDRPAGSLELVRPLLDRCDAQRTEDCDFGGASRRRCRGRLAQPGCWPVSAASAPPPLGQRGRRRPPRRALQAGRPAAPARPPAAPSTSAFPMWAIILLIVIVLVAIWWFVSQNQKPEPAKQGMLDAPIGFVLTALPGQRARAELVASILSARVLS